MDIMNTHRTNMCVCCALCVSDGFYSSKNQNSCERFTKKYKVNNACVWCVHARGKWTFYELPADDRICRKVFHLNVLKDVNPTNFIERKTKFILNNFHCVHHFILLFRVMHCNIHGHIITH